MGVATTFQCEEIVQPNWLRLMLDQPEHCSYWQFINNKRGTNQMLFDLSPYLPLPAFIILWAIGMLALVAFFDRNDKEGK
jgi:hypothetical protein